MKFSKSLIKTTREIPKDVESRSHQILIRGGFIRQLTSGINIYLPLGWRVLRKIENIIREEHDSFGAQELFLPALAPKEIWQESGRWEEYGDDMFRLKDRRGRDYCLCPTHEEIIAEIARNKIRSYRDLPQSWYQIQTKYRDEMRPRAGVIRTREFIMKDSYSLDRDEEGLDKSFNHHKEAYVRILKRCGLEFEIVDASGGLMGTGESKEFVALVKGGEDTAVICESCDYRANLDVARGMGEFISHDDIPVTEVHTPGMKTVEEVSEFLEVKPSNLVKSMFFVAPGRTPILILLRGDYAINEETIKKEFGFDFKPASPEEIFRYFAAEPGFIGPQGIDDIEIYADDLLKETTGMITGANKNDYHIKGLNLARDIKVVKYLNIKKVKKGDSCPQCHGLLKLHDGIELGHIFKLGTKYSKPLGAMFLDEKGEEKPIVMGSYGIGPARIMACACEQKADEKGAAWPISIAPFDLYVVVLNPSDKTVFSVADEVTKGLTAQGFSSIVDDRDISAGTKFNDSELLGIPIRVTIGPKGIQNNKIDIYLRNTGDVLEARKTDIIEKCTKIREELYRRLHV